MSIDRTHDISCGDFHIKDLEEFGQLLEGAANAAFPRRLPRYAEVHVLLLSWEDDNLGVITEVSELGGVFRQVYCYEVEEWRIPSDHCYKALRKHITRFLNKFEDKNNLLIVYYGGHGFMNDDRQCIWSCTGTHDSASVQWSGLQELFENAESDALILLDCCAAASSISSTGSGVTEIIAACGFETWAHGVGEHSFTRSLIDELRYWSRGPTLSVAMLHNKVLSRIKYWKPRFGMTGEDEHRKTPIYIVLSHEGNQRSIGLIPLQRNGPPLVGSVDASSQGLHSEDSESFIEAHSIADDSPLDSSQSSIDRVWPDREFDHPKVIISLSLEEDQSLYMDAWVDWIRSVPALIKYTNVDGIFKSSSTLLVLSIPVALWDLLPKDPAISFIGFVNSSNLLYNSLPPFDASHESIKTKAETPNSTLIKSPLLAMNAGDKNSYLLAPNPSTKTESHDARIVFNQTLDGHNRRGSQGYRKVGALLLTWKDDNLQCKDTEVDKLRLLFAKSFNFKTIPFEIPSERWKSALHRQLADFCYEYDSPEDLAIIYYGGHKYKRRETKEMNLGAEYVTYGGDDTLLNEIGTCLQLPTCDQLVILDSVQPSKAFTGRTVKNRKFDLLASAGPDVASSGADLPHWLTRKLKDVLRHLLKENPKGFSTSDVYRTLCYTVPFDKLCTPLLFDQAQNDLGRIWLRPQVEHAPLESQGDREYLKLELKLVGDPEISMMNEIAFYLQRLPHVEQVKLKGLFSPREQLTDFMRMVVQAQKIRPLIRRIVGRRLLRKAHSHKTTVPSSLSMLSLSQNYQPTYDWSKTMPYDDTVNFTKAEDSSSDAQTYLGDHKRPRSPGSDQGSPPSTRLRWFSY